MKKGLVHIYYGTGKGKTTAATGLTVRCIGAGKKVLFFQFLKDGTSSEISMLKKLGVDVLEGMDSVKFTKSMTTAEKEEAKLFYTQKLEHISNIMYKYDMVVLDELTVAIHCGFVLLEKAVDFIKNKPESTELVITGVYGFEELTELADYVSRIDKVKHPFDRGIKARKAIEM